eukprot:Clim_evm42s109 gene=Clim_evmTU42s109
MESTENEEKLAPPVTPDKKAKKGKYRKDKPWDTDDIDHWKIDEWKSDYMPAPLLEESSFATLFPKYREKYLKECWPHVTRALKDRGVDCVLDLVEGSMTVKTTRKTWDPFVIIKARDMIKLLARSVPYQQAIKILQDEMACDIIKIGGTVRNKERFVKRRQRLLGPNGSTLKAIELLTECYILVQGNTVSVMGEHKGLKQVRKIVLECMNNIHPVYNIKTLMIKRELSRDPALANENWDRFLPNFKKRNVQSQKPKKSKKKDRALFPPAQQPSKIDLQLESGEYFMKPEEKQRQKNEALAERTAQNMEAKKRARQEAFKAPTKAEPKLQETGANSSAKGRKRAADLDVSELASKFKKQSTTTVGIDSVTNAKKAKSDADLLLKKKKKKEKTK